MRTSVAIRPLWKQFAKNKMIWLFLILMKIVSFSGKISTKYTTFHGIPKFIRYFLVDFL